ncbi:uncharacterized protein TRIADDRAFT_61648 [Trichoplax adhaerens]|uniref:Gamma-butyrobetaine dioxygenase n=1 Tax=Trichoplax adhaerens TaxID=10228 RepID=B3SBK5_TRIAD|nr:hypothetical protein TRIADDRAFT_61648 [Trichoplax adhaerens]EDV19874.1 hypothetical protein TRIADDRAFT_61648 [Trichoplax adhaerens]|eukprot:XP_002117616.1 hypothetical protein TRIADDRAFT_61648 [Trichoplax adhaerens]
MLTRFVSSTARRLIGRCLLENNYSVTTARLQCKRTFASSAASTFHGKSQYRFTHVLPVTASSTKVIWNDSLTADINYLWLRDNCQCSECKHPHTGQKLFDITRVPLDLQPQAIEMVDEGSHVRVVWDNDQHESVYDSHWLRANGRHFFINIPSESSKRNSRPQEIEWNQHSITENPPVMSYDEIKSSEVALYKWISLIHRYGVAIVKGTPIEKDFILDMAERIAYVKETSYGKYFDVVVEPKPNSHLAFSARGLDHHTDMNYRENSPGLQMLHCLKNNHDVSNPGGRTFFVDGLHVVSWLKKHHPSAFYTLCSIEVKFELTTESFTYNQTKPIICLDKDGNFSEIHVNNRTMGPIQAPKETINPFYSAYNILMRKIRDPELQYSLGLQPGDLVAFNNRRVLHGRSAFNSDRVSRHLVGCYVDYDEMLSKLDTLYGKGFFPK